MTRRKWHDLLRQADQILGLRGENYRAGAVVSIVQWAYADGIPGCNQRAAVCVVNDQRELRVEHLEHAGAILFVQR